MESFSLRADIDLIQTFCSQRGIALFYGLPESSHSALCLWNKESSQALPDYLAVLPVVGAKVLHVAIAYNECAPAEIEVFQKAIAAQPKQKHKALNVLVTQLQKDKGAPFTLTMTFMFGGIQYAYVTHSGLLSLYESLAGLVSSESDKQQLSALSQRRKLVPFSNSISANRISPESMAILARKIATDPAHIHARNQTERREMARKKAGQEGVRLSSDRDTVATKAEEIFTNEMVEVREKERKLRVQDTLKKFKGRKISQRSLGKLLNIPEDELYKYMNG